MNCKLRIPINWIYGGGKGWGPVLKRQIRARPDAGTRFDAIWTTGGAKTQ